MPIFNGTATYVHRPVQDTDSIAIDASLQTVGGVWNNEIYSISIPDYMKNEDHNITYFEMVNIIVALNLWKERWSKCHINIYVDNAAVVDMSNRLY